MRSHRLLLKASSRELRELGTEDFLWSPLGEPSSMGTSIGPHLEELGAVPTLHKDLVKLAVLVFLALGSFGLYQFRMPAALTQFAGTASQGVLGALFMGLTMGIVAAPCVGPIVADGPLAAGLGEAAGHVAGGIARALHQAGLERAEAERWQKRIEEGAILIGAHVDPASAGAARDIFVSNGVASLAEATWSD